jgi:hypothetical protein
VSLCLADLLGNTQILCMGLTITGTEYPNAESTADGTMKSYLVYEDGSVEPNK